MTKYFFKDVNQEILNIGVDDVSSFIRMNNDIKLINLNTGHVIKSLNINRYTLNSRF